MTTKEVDLDFLGAIVDANAGTTTFVASVEIYRDENKNVC